MLLADGGNGVLKSGPSAFPTAACGSDYISQRTSNGPTTVIGVRRGTPVVMAPSSSRPPMTQAVFAPDLLGQESTVTQCRPDSLQHRRYLRMIIARTPTAFHRQQSH